MSCDEKWSYEKWSCDGLWCDELWDEAARREREQERRDPSEKQEPHTVMWGKRAVLTHFSDDVLVFRNSQNAVNYSQHFCVLTSFAGTCKTQKML